MQSNKSLIFFAFIAIVLLGITSWVVLNQIDSKTRLKVGQSLSAVLETSHQAIHSWLEEHESEAMIWADTVAVREAAEALLATDRSQASLSAAPSQARLRQWLLRVHIGKDYQGYFIIGPDYINLASSRDQNVGQTTLLKENETMLRRIWSGEAMVSLPQRSDVPLPDKDGVLREDMSTMFAGAPIKDESGKVMAIFVFRLDPNAGFTSMLQRGRTGASGETYAFDHNGRLVSNSRFNAQLRAIGLLAPDQQGILNIELRDPGGDLTEGELSEISRQQQAWTRMAGSALAGDSGLDLDGYRDYRGREVVGAWLWDPELGLGIVTEMDETEAYQNLRASRNIIIIFTLLSMLLVIGLAWVIITNRQRKQAEKAIEESETKFRNLVEGSLQGIFVHRDFKPLFANQKCADIFGYDNPEEILKLDSILDVFWVPEERERIRDYRTRRMAGADAPNLYETQGMRRDGSPFWFENHVTLIDWQGEKAVQVAIIDITERKQAEKALRESEQYNRMLFQESTIGLALCRKNGELVDVNPAYAKILGRTVEKTLQLSYWDVTPEKYAEQEQAQLECLEKTGGYGPYEKEYIHADGHLVPVRLSGHILEKDGEEFIWSGAEDITERKRAEAALSQSEARLAQFFNSAFEPLIFHEGGRIVDINPAGIEIGGYEYGEMIGMNMLEFVHPDSHQAIIVAMEAGGTDVPLEIDVVKKDGTKIPVEIHAKELEFEGRSIRAVGLYDISERKQAEEALRKAHDDMEGLVEERTAQLQRSESLYRALFNNAGVGITIANVQDNGRFLQVNDAVVDFLGYERDELLSKTIMDITYAGDLAVTATRFRDLLDGQSHALHIEKRYVRKDGTIVWGDANSTVIKDEVGNNLYVIGVISDISQRKQFEEILLKSEAQLNMAQHFAHLGSWELDFASNELSWSDEVYRIFEIEAEGFTVSYEAFLDMVHPDDREFVDKTYADSLQKKTSYDIEHRLLMKDGRIKYIDEHCETIYDDNGKPLRSIGTTLDITERKRAEQQEASRSLVLERLASGASLDEVMKVLLEGVETIWPKMRCSVLLLDKEGKNLQLFAAPSLPDFFKQSMNAIEVGMEAGACGRAVYTGEVAIIEDVMTHPYCSRHCDLATRAGSRACWSYPIRSASNVVMGALACYYTEPRQPNDVEMHSIRTVAHLAGIAIDRKRAEETLRNLSRAVEQSPVSIVVTDTNGAIEYVNPKFSDITGYSSDEVIGRNPGIVKSGNHSGEFYKDLWDTITSGKIWQGKLHNRKKNNELYWENASISPIFDDKGEITSFVGVKEDITQRKRAEDALHNLVKGTAAATGEDFFRVLVRHMAKALEVRDAFIGEIIKPEEVSVRTIAAWSGTSFQTNFNYDLFGTPCAEVIAGGELCAYPQDVQRLFPEDQLLVVMGAESYVGVPLCASTGESLGLLAVVDSKPMQDLDLSKSIISIFAGRAAAELERIRAEEQERQHMLELAHISRLSTMGEMATEMAHELNQPLTAISSYGEAALNLIASDLSVSDDVKDALREITNQAYLAGEIIRRLRAFIRKEASPRINICINQVIEEVLQLAHVEARGQGISLVQKLGSPLPKVQADKILVEQVLINLIRNAIEVMSSEQVSERRLTIHTTQNDQGEIEIAISDSGPGLVSAELEKVFDSFYTTKDDGMGMGLSISRSIIEAHDGKLWAISTPGEGTTFQFTLPGIVMQEASHAD